MWEILKKILNLEIVQDFLKNAEDPQVSVKDLTTFEIKKLFAQFPNLFPKLFQQEIIKNENKHQESPIIKVITVVKNKKDISSLSKVSKLKIYFHEINNRILKILNI